MVRSASISQADPKDARLNDTWQVQWSWWLSLPKVLHTYVMGFLYHRQTTSSSSTSTSLNDAMLHERVWEQKTIEKYYRFNDHGRVLKRSLRKEECYIQKNGEQFLPPLVVERLRNEAECMKFVKQNTNIPVPELLDTYEKNGSYHVWMEYVDGVAMSQLSEEEQSKVIPQVQDVVTALQKLRSSRSGGPTGILCPPSRVYARHFSEWEQQSSMEEEFVFCHCDLSQDNILVDAKTLKIVAVIDWEYSGFYPQEHEIPFYRSSEFSGIQITQAKYEQVVDNIVEFWRQSQKTTS